MSTAVIVPVIDDEHDLLEQMLDALGGEAEQVIVVTGLDERLHDLCNRHHEVLIAQADIRSTSVHFPARAVRQGMSCVRPDIDWVCVLTPGERFAPPGHPAYKLVPSYMLPNAIQVTREETEAFAPGRMAALLDPPQSLDGTLDLLPPTVNSAVCPIVTVCDGPGMEAVDVQRSARLVRRQAEAEWENFGFRTVEGHVVHLPGLPILLRPTSIVHLEAGCHALAHRAASIRLSPIDRRTMLLARTEIDRREALEALKILFTHCSLYEELRAASKLLYSLPYTLELAPEVAEMRSLLQFQIGHLAESEEAWYRDGSPAEVVTERYLDGFPDSFPHRMHWIVEEARARGYKRILEFGALDGVNLIPWAKLAPEIEWHGLEVNPRAVEHGRQMASHFGVQATFHCAGFQEFADTLPDKFDAVTLLEVLEHNFDPAPVLKAAEACVRPGGRVFICTPNGAWSLYDDQTRKVRLRKDHVRAWTAERMSALLCGRGCSEIQVKVVDNPNRLLVNSWVVASYVPGKEMQS